MKKTIALLFFLAVFASLSFPAALASTTTQPEFSYEIRIDKEGTVIVATVFRQGVQRTVASSLSDYDLAKAHSDPQYIPKLIRSLYVQGAAEIRFQQALARHRAYRVDTSGIDASVDALATSPRISSTCVGAAEAVLEAANR